MSIASEINRIKGAVNDIKDALAAKSADVSEDLKINDLADLIENLPSGSDSTLIGLIQRDLTSLDVPDGTTSIGDYAFSQFTSLESITIPNSVTTIGSGAFSSCTNLTSIKIGNAITSIGMAAFSSCSHIDELTIKATTPPTVGSYVFMQANIQNLYVPATSVNAYKNASGWSTFASVIKPIINTLEF